MNNAEKTSRNVKIQRLVIIIAIIAVIATVIIFLANQTLTPDAIAGATVSINQSQKYENTEGKKMLIILYSGNKGNTRKLANAIADEITAVIYEPGESGIIPDDIENYELIGFGSGIFSEKHHALLLEFAKNMPAVENKAAFIFSTCGVYSDEYMDNNHKALSDILLGKGFTISGEFSCPGHNTNSFLRLFGGINKDRPNKKDLENATDFAHKLLNNMEEIKND
jgi:flavodoxin